LKRIIIVALAVSLAACAAPSTLLQNDQGQVVTCSAAGFGILGTATALVAHGNCVDTYKSAGFHEPGASSTVAQSGPSTATSKDGTIQLLLPSGWQQADFPTKSGQPIPPAILIYARNISLDAALVVTSDDKRDIEIAGYEAVIQNRLVAKMTETQSSPIENLVINQHSAMRFDASGVIDGVRYHYLATIVETPTKMLKLNAWTLESKFADRRDGLAILVSGLSWSSNTTAQIPGHAIASDAGSTFALR
jgi:hypothetical protein